MGAGGACEIASGTFLNRRREDVAASVKQNSLAFRAQARMLDQVGRRNPVGAAIHSIVGNRDGNRLRLPGLYIEHLQLAVELEDDAALAVAARPSHVPGCVFGDLGSLSTGRVIGVEIEMAIAVGVEEDLISDPHRVAGGAWAFGNPLSLVGLDVENVQDICRAAAVAFLGPEVTRLRGIDNLVAARRE